MEGVKDDAVSEHEASFSYPEEPLVAEDRVSYVYGGFGFEYQGGGGGKLFRGTVDGACFDDTAAAIRYRRCITKVLGA